MRVPSFVDLDLVSKGAGLHQSDEQRRLRMMEALGDAVLTTVLGMRCLLADASVARYQNTRSSALCGAAQARAFVHSPLVRLVTFPAGVDPGSGRHPPGAGALEAVAGLVFKYGGLEAVGCLVDSLGLLPHSLFEGVTPLSLI